MGLLDAPTRWLNSTIVPTSGPYTVDLQRPYKGATVWDAFEVSGNGDVMADVTVKLPNGDTLCAATVGVAGGSFAPGRWRCTVPELPDGPTQLVVEQIDEFGRVSADMVDIIIVADAPDTPLLPPSAIGAMGLLLVPSLRRYRLGRERKSH